MIFSLLIIEYHGNNKLNNKLACNVKLYFFIFRLVQRKNVKFHQRKHEGSKNPLKALATNRDLAQQKYTENKSNLLLQRSLETCKYTFNI